MALLCERWVDLPCRFADAVKATAQDAEAPRLFIEVKNAAYTSDTIDILWREVEDLGVADQVALWAMDPPHFHVLKSVAGGRVNVIWSYNDMVFEDVLSRVPFPAPVPPQVDVRCTPALRRHGWCLSPDCLGGRGQATMRPDQPLCVQGVHMFGIAKRAPVRYDTELLGPDAMIMLWLMDTVLELEDVCHQGVDMLVTNRPLMLQAASASVAARCVPSAP